MKINPIILIILLTASLSEVFPAKLVVIGFKDRDPKTEFITAAFIQFLRQNLEEAEFEIMDDKAEGLDLALLKNNNFFLATKEYFDEYENIELDNAMNGFFDYKGKTVYLNIEVYSREKRKLVMKAELKGNKQALLAFFYQVTKEIIASMGVEHTVKNIFPIEDENYFYKYIKFNYEADKLFQSNDPDKYYSLLDELDAIKDKFTEYPVFAELYADLTSQTEEYETAGAFDKPFSYVAKAVFAEDDEVERFARELLVNGYLFSFNEIIQVPMDDKDQEEVNIAVNYTVKLKKSYRNNLIKEIKKRKGNSNFTDMGRYFFSLNENESKVFRDFLLRQTVMLRLFDENGVLIAESEQGIDNSDYSNGAYRHSKILPLPITPRGPANTAFGVSNSSKLTFVFEDIKKTDIKRIARTEIEILFE